MRFIAARGGARVSAGLPCHHAGMIRRLAVLAPLILTATAAAQTAPVVRAVPPSTIEATFEHLPLLPPAQLLLRDGGHAVSARTVTDFAHGHETIAVALVVEAAPAVLPVAAQAIASAKLGAALPATSLGTVVTYGTAAQLRVPVGPLARLTPDVLGAQDDVLVKGEANLVEGARLAISELAKSTAEIKLLVVIGDGSDRAGDDARGPLRELQARATRAHISVASIAYRAPGTNPHRVVTALAPGSLTVDSAEAMAAGITSAIATATDRTTVTWDASDVAWDGKLHTLAITAGVVTFDAVSVLLPESAPTRRPGPLWWLRSPWAQLGAGLAIVGLVMLFMRWRASRQKAYR